MSKVFPLRPVVIPSRVVKICLFVIVGCCEEGGRGTGGKGDLWKACSKDIFPKAHEQIKVFFDMILHRFTYFFDGRGRCANYVFSKWPRKS